MIVDCYCDVCGSPAGAAPYVPAMTAAAALDEEPPTQPLSRLRMPAQQLSPQESAERVEEAASALDEEPPTQPLSRLRMPAQQLSPQEPADPVTADPAAVDTKEVGRGKELTQNEIDVAHDYRTRVDEAQLPDDVREAVLYEVAKLERTGDQSPESDDIRNWLDTMLELPWSTEISDSIDIEGSRDVEATLRGLIKPAVADVEEGDTAKVFPAEVDTVNIDQKKELAGNETDGSQDFDMRVEETQPPDEVRLTALREVGMLERTSDQSPESDDIRNGLDTVLDLPWSTEIMESIDIEGSRDVEATLRGLIKPAVADVDESGTGEVEPLVADLEEGDPAEVEPLLADLEGDPGEVEPLLADLEEGDAGEVEPWVADFDESDPAEVEPLLADLEGDPGEVEPLLADLEEGDASEVEPWVADFDESDPAEVEPVAADSENAYSAHAGPHDDDTVETPAVLAPLSGHVQPPLQRPEQQVVGPVLVKTPTKKRRVRSLTLAAATALAALVIGALVFGASRDGSVTPQSAPAVTASATATVSQPTSQPSNQPTRTGAASPIRVQELTEPARAFQTVRIKGRFLDGPDTSLRVQRWEGGKWLDFPLIAQTDKSGRFTAYVELGGQGRYELRVLDPNSLVTSETFVLVIKR
jgi:hypothetical protein